MSFPIDAILPVAASILTLIFSQSHSRKIADDDRAERARQANNDRSVQVKENRYADRRDAVIDLIAAAEDEANRITDFERENMYGAESPGDIYDDYSFPALNTACAKLILLATPATRDAATKLRDGIYACFSGRKDAWPEYHKVMDDFLEASRAMLTE